MVKFLSFIGVFLVSTAFGQTFRNIRVLKEEEKIVIIYDLINVEQGSKVIVKIFSSHDNFTNALTSVIGDVGEVLPGPNRRIEWSNENIPKNYSGELTFQFKGEVIHGWTFLNPGNGVLRRGKKYTLKWEGGQVSDTVSLKFILPGQQIAEIHSAKSSNQQIIDISTTKNTGSFKWRVPKNLKTGLGYTLRISKGKDVFEQQITIKRKVPIGLIAIPVAGAVIVLLISGNESGGDESLPDAPKPN